MMWIILIGVMAVIGSVMMLKPSARDSRLAALRFDAIKLGLQVRQISFEPDPKTTGVWQKVTGTAYSLIREGQANPGKKRYSVVFQKGWESAGLPEGYSWYEVGSEADALKVAAILEQVTDRLLVLEVYEHGAQFIAAENSTASAANYQKVLQALL